METFIRFFIYLCTSTYSRILNCYSASKSSSTTGWDEAEDRNREIVLKIDKAYKINSPRKAVIKY
jgi:hypothetical protein